MERTSFMIDNFAVTMLIASIPPLFALIGALAMVTVGRRRSRMAICLAGIGTAAAALSAGALIECRIVYMGLSNTPLGGGIGWGFFWDGGHATYFALYAAAGALVISSLLAVPSRPFSNGPNPALYILTALVGVSGSVGSFAAMDRVAHDTMRVIAGPSSVTGQGLKSLIDFVFAAGTVGLISATLLVAIALARGRRAAFRDSLVWAAIPGVIAALVLIEIPRFRGELASYYHVKITGSYAEVTK